MTTVNRAEILLLAALLLASLAEVPGAAAVVEVGEEAPDFTLPATTGGKITLSQFRGMKHVLLEFYGVDFEPV